MTSFRRARLRTLVALTASTVLGCGLLAATGTATQAEPTTTQGFEQCPDAVGHDTLVEDQEVTGLTTTKGTTPEEFTGTFVGTLPGEIGRNRDLLVFRLEGSRITKADGTPDAGIWAGISGSPVYTDDGRLVGSVSYGFNDGDDNLAGVTPGQYLYDLKALRTPESIALRPLSAELKRQDVTVTRSASLRRLGSTRQVSGFSAAAFGTAKRLAERAGLDSSALARGTAPLANGPELPVVAGGNVGASYSYGDVTLASIGSVTAVCGQDVFAYGHPDEWDGETRQGLHGASAVAISRGSESYKLAALGASVGTITDDRLEGLYGTLGDVPISVDLTSRTKFNGRTTNGSTVVTELPALSYVVAAQTASDVQAATNSAYAGGAARITWTFTLERANGAQRTYTRSQRYSSRSDLAEFVVGDVASDVESILENPFEDAKIRKISITNDVVSDYRAYRISGVERYSKKKWRAVKHNARISLKRGSLLQLRVKLVAADRHAKVSTITRRMNFRTSKYAARDGRIDITGRSQGWMTLDDLEDFEDGIYWEGDDYEESDPYVVPTKDPRSFSELLTQMAKQPRHDQMVSTLAHRGRNTGRLVNTSKTMSLDAIVSGQHRIRLRFS